MVTLMKSIISKVMNEDFNDLVIKLSYEDVKGLDEVIKDIISLKNSDFYEKLYHAFILGNKINERDSGFYERLTNVKRVIKWIYSKNPSPDHLELVNSNIVVLGNKYLTKAPRVPIFGNLIDIVSLYSMYNILNCIYYINIERKLKREDVENLFLSKLDERIVSALDKFDEIDNIPDVDDEYFIKLKRINWENKHAKMFFKNLKKIYSIIENEKFGFLRFSKFRITQNSFILLLAACNAVNHDRDKISKKDVIKGYKTYFKLLKTDITKYKAKPYEDLKPDSKKIK